MEVALRREADIGPLGRPGGRGGVREKAEPRTYRGEGRHQGFKQERKSSESPEKRL